ncbi:MAG: hypothetical protein GQ565_11645 [Candidatus Aegiribacteria sp.]|nr:hypothetical protein [Candidatus Aegiribacteria sp.]
MYKVILFLIPVLILSACGDTTVIPSNTDQTTTAGPIDPYADPPGYTGDPFEDFPEVIGMSVPGEEVPIEYEEEILSGTHFTVQISAATNEETAMRLKESVSAEINHPVFIDHQGGFWKVRVGAFPAREDAVNYTHVLVNMGFTDAWVTTRDP